MSKEMLTSLQQVASGTKYPLDAFLFVQRGLEFTVNRIHGENVAIIDEDETADEDTAFSRHVTGQDLCVGLRDFAIQEYGVLARTVLRRWRINQTEDFGRIVFAMVEARLMNKTDQDNLHDFVDVFDFDEAFAPIVQLTEN